MPEDQPNQSPSEKVNTDRQSPPATDDQPSVTAAKDTDKEGVQPAESPTSNPQETSSSNLPPSMVPSKEPSPSPAKPVEASPASKPEAAAAAEKATTLQKAAAEEAAPSAAAPAKDATTLHQPAPQPPAPTGDAAKSGEEEDDIEKEVVSGNWIIPTVDAAEVAVATGEESEAVEWQHRGKLYRWHSGEWKERGLGDAKLLRDQEGRVRFLLRQERTLKIVANHYVIPTDDSCILKPNAGNDKIWTWFVLDCAEDPAVVEHFALRFISAEVASKFKEEFERVGKSNLKLLEEGKFEDS